MTRGKVVLVAFPFDDLRTDKARPAICLTEPLGNHSHVVLAFVTSRQPDDPLDTDIALDPGDPDFALTGLRVRSVVRAHRLLTVSSTVIKRELGRLSTERLGEVARSVRQLFEAGTDSAEPVPADPRPSTPPDPGSR